jgi:hypothetical protein
MTNHALGRITCQECLALLVMHPLRHATQIEEIRNSPDFRPIIRVKQVFPKQRTRQFQIC